MSNLHQIQISQFMAKMIHLIISNTLYIQQYRKNGVTLWAELFVVIVSLLSGVQLLAHQAPLSTGLPRQEYWSGLPFRSPGDRPNPGTEPGSLALQMHCLPLSHQGSPG